MRAPTWPSLHSPSTSATLQFAAAALIALLAMWRAGNAPMAFDELWLVGAAAADNHVPQWADVGLRGTARIEYGPLTLQLHQVLLAVTHGDVIALVRLRAGLLVFVTAASLVALSRQIGLSGYYGLLTVLAPDVWFQLRGLWDNPLLLPTTAVALAAYAWFVRTGRTAAAGICIARLMLAVLTHTMVAPLALAIFGHAVIMQRRSIVRAGWGVAVALVMLLPLYAGYVQHNIDRAMGLLSHGQGSSLWVGEPMVDPEPIESGIRAIRQSGRLASFCGGFLGAMPLAVGVVDGPIGAAAATTILLAVYPLSIAGIVVAGRHASSVKRSAAARDEMPADATTTTRSTRAAIEVVCVVAIAVNLTMFAALRLQSLPHYFHGIVVAFAVMTWLGLSAIHNAIVRRSVGGLLVAAGATQLALGYRAAASTGSIGGEPTIQAYVNASRALGTSYPYPDFYTNLDSVYRYPDRYETFRRTVCEPLGGTRAPATTQPGPLVLRWDPRADGSRLNVVKFDESSTAGLYKIREARVRGVMGSSAR